MKISISYTGLMLIYAIIPVCVLVALADLLWLDSYLKLTLPNNPEDLRFVTVFLVLPHIVASAISFLDREYLSFYRNQLIWAVPLILIGVPLLPVFLGAPLAFLIYATYTVYHVMAQQVGVTTLMVGRPTGKFVMWKWLVIIVFLVMYLMVFTASEWWEQLLFSFTYQQIVIALIGVGFCLMVWVSVPISRASQTRSGTIYLWSNNAMFFVSFVLWSVDYSFFAILIPRVVHDLTAFVFYVVHDHNRNMAGAKNVLLGLFRSIGIPIYILSPLLALLIANLIIEAKGAPFMHEVVLVLAYFHYYTEGIMWKRESIHRQAISIKKAQWSETT